MKDTEQKTDTYRDEWNTENGMDGDLDRKAQLSRIRNQHGAEGVKNRNGVLLCSALLYSLPDSYPLSNTRHN